VGSIMVTVQVEPTGLDLEVGAGQSVMAAAEGQGLFLPTACHRLAECQTCFFEVVRVEEHLDPYDQLEEAPPVPRTFVARGHDHPSGLSDTRAWAHHHPEGRVRPARWPGDPADEHHLDREP
jgi:hypothetical protein